MRIPSVVAAWIRHVRACAPAGHVTVDIGLLKNAKFQGDFKKWMPFSHLSQILYELEKKSSLVTRALSAKSCARDTDSLHSCTRLRLVQEMACLYHSCKILPRKHSYPNLIPITCMLQVFCIKKKNLYFFEEVLLKCYYECYYVMLLVLLWRSVYCVLCQKILPIWISLTHLAKTILSHYKLWYVYYRLAEDLFSHEFYFQTVFAEQELSLQFLNLSVGIPCVLLYSHDFLVGHVTHSVIKMHELVSGEFTTLHVVLTLSLISCL